MDKQTKISKLKQIIANTGLPQTSRDIAKKELAKLEKETVGNKPAKKKTTKLPANSIILQVRDKNDPDKVEGFVSVKHDSKLADIRMKKLNELMEKAENKFGDEISNAHSRRLITDSKGNPQYSISANGKVIRDMMGNILDDLNETKKPLETMDYKKTNYEKKFRESKKMFESKALGNDFGQEKIKSWVSALRKIGDKISDEKPGLKPYIKEEIDTFINYVKTLLVRRFEYLNKEVYQDQENTSYRYKDGDEERYYKILNDFADDKIPTRSQKRDQEQAKLDAESKKRFELGYNRDIYGEPDEGTHKYYYVTAISGLNKKKEFLLGPFDNHIDALRSIAKVEPKVKETHSEHLAFGGGMGTAGTNADNVPPGKLNKYFPELVGESKTTKKTGKGKPDKYDIIFTNAGGLTIASNKAVKDKGDYQKLAGISKTGKITWYKEDLPDHVLKQIKDFADQKEPKYDFDFIAVMPTDGIIDEANQQVEPEEFDKTKKYSSAVKAKLMKDLAKDECLVYFSVNEAEQMAEDNDLTIPGLIEEIEDGDITLPGGEIDVIDIFKSQPANCPPMKNGKRRIDKEGIEQLKQCIAKQTQTKTLHTDSNGNYTPERKKLHDNIVKAFKAKAPCIVKKDPVAILTGGAPGSGKSYFLKNFAPWINGDNLLHIDADEVRAKLPEYKGWNADITHLETKDIVNRLLDEVGFPCKTDIVYDGTMNKAKNYEPLIKRIKDAGYKVYIIYLQVPYEVSRKRVLDRYQRKGRYVPMHVVDEVFERGLDAYEKLIKKADGYVRVDGQTHKILEKGGQDIPKDRNYFRIGADAKDKEPPPEEIEKEIHSIIRELEADRQDKKLSEQQVIDYAKRIHSTRKKRSRTMDASKTSKKRLAPTSNNVLRWALRPGDYDLIGVDCLENATATIKAREVKKAKVFNLFGL